jgi:hypothetical protein
MADSDRDDKHDVEISQASETVVRKRLLRKTDFLVLPGLCMHLSYD